MTDEQKAKMNEAEKKALGIVEKHIEAMAAELVPVGKEIADIALEGASPLVKLIYGATAPQLVATLTALIPQLDLNKDGQ